MKYNLKQVFLSFISFPLTLFAFLGLETELLTDYYLIPGAEWTLLKKGDTVKVLGKAGADGRWFRCMALRDTDVKIPDLSLPPPSIVNALLPGTIIGQEEKGTTSSRGGLSSQLQQDVVMEEPLNEAMEEALEEEDGSLGEYKYEWLCSSLLPRYMYIHDQHATVEWARGRS